MLRNLFKKTFVLSLVIIILMLLSQYLEQRSVQAALSRNPEIREHLTDREAAFLSDGYFDEIDELYNRTKVEHDRWYLIEGSNQIAAYTVITNMMEDLTRNPDTLVNHVNFNRFFGTFDHYIRKLEFLTEDMHYFRNTLNSYSHAPKRLDEMITWAADGKWKLFSAKFHRYNVGEVNAALNVKFISADGRFEAVYNTGTGEMVTDPVNMGTYNYAPGSVHPIRYYYHHIYDKVPWKKWGNTREVSFEEIIRLESRHGSAEAINNTQQVERWIQERMADRKIKTAEPRAYLP